MLYFIIHDLLQAMCQSPQLWMSFHKRLLSTILQSIPHLLSVNAPKAKKSDLRSKLFQADGSLIPDEAPGFLMI